MAASGVPPIPDPLFANRFDPLEGLPHDEGTAKSHPKFQAQGVYKPPHMRTLAESTVSATDLDPTGEGTETVRPAHGPSLDYEGKRTFRPRTPHAGSVPAVAAFGFDEVKKQIHEELLTLRKAAEEVEMMEKGLLEDEARFKQQIRVLKNGGLTDEEIRMIMDGYTSRFPSRPPTVQPLDVNVGICLYILLLGGGTYLRFDRALRLTWHTLTPAPSRRSNEPWRPTRKKSHDRMERSW